jgi:hypothetical protein
MTPGTQVSDPDFRVGPDREEADLEDDLDGFNICPVFSANLYFRF